MTSCDGCRYIFDERCHKNPPSVISTDVGIETMFPFAIGACGEYAKRDMIPQETKVSEPKSRKGGK